MFPMIYRLALAFVLLAGLSGPALADDHGQDGNQGGDNQGGPGEHQQCAIPQATVALVQGQLGTAVQGGNGGLFNPNVMWSAVVDRRGVLCSVINSNADAWPGS